jgi:hypothetical protein
MLTDFFTSGRTMPADSQPAGLGRWSPLTRRVLRCVAVPGDVIATPSDVDRSDAPKALSAASEAERLKRLRASFEDDLAHFLRGASAPAAE